MALQCVVQQPRTAAAPARGFHDREVRRRGAEAAMFEEIDGVEISASKTRAGPVDAAAFTRNGYLDDLGGEHRQVEPPCRRQAAGGRAVPVSPHGGANP